MAYGTVKVDTIIFDQGGADQNVTVSGIYRAITSGVTVTGTISGAVLIGTTTVSGATVTGTTVQGISGTFTTLTGTTTTGTTANFASGVFTTRVSGTTITGTTAQFTSGTFVSLTGTTITGTTISGTTVSSTTGTFTSLTGTTTTGITVNFTSGVFTTQVSGATVTGTQSSFTSGNFVTLSGATATFTSGVIASGTATNPSLSIVGDGNTGIYSPGADQVAVATNGTGRLFVDSAGLVGIGTSSPNEALHIASGGARISSSLIGGGASSLGLDYESSNARFISYGPDVSTQTGLIFLTGNSTASTTIERLRITSAGLVGIGTSAPNYQLHVTTDFAVGASGFNQQLTFGNDTIQSLLLGTGYTALKLNPLGGNVGIGTSSPGTLTHLRGTNATTNFTINNPSGLFTLQDTSSSAGAGAKIAFGASYDGTNSLGQAIIGASKEPGTGSGADQYRSSLVFHTSNYASGVRETMRLDPDGRLGIGTTSPSDKLEARGGAVVVGFSDNTTRTNKLFAGFGYETGGTLYGNVSIRSSYDNTNNSSTLNFHTASGAGADTERARIDSSGRLLVGTSTARSIATQSLAIQNEGTSFGTTGFSTCRNSNDIYGPYIHFGKTRGASVGSNTLVSSGDDLGGLIFGGGDGTDVDSQAAYILCQVDGTPGANDMPGRLVFSTTADGASSPTERMRIDALGALKTSPNGTYKFPAGTTEITHNDATSSVQLIASSTGFTGDAVTISTYRNTVNDSYKFLACIRQGFAVALEIRDDGDVYNVNGTYGSLSDVKLKENIVDANSQWDDIRQLRVRNYNFKPETNNSTHKQIGVIAQEIEDVSPGLVNTVPDRDEDGNDLGTVTKSVNYSVLYMKAVKALQEAMTRIETLEADVALLKSA